MSCQSRPLRGSGHDIPLTDTAVWLTMLCAVYIDVTSYECQMHLVHLEWRVRAKGASKCAGCGCHEDVTQLSLLTCILFLYSAVLSCNDLGESGE